MRTICLLLRSRRVQLLHKKYILYCYSKFKIEKQTYIPVHTCDRCAETKICEMKTHSMGKNSSGLKYYPNIIHWIYSVEFKVQ